uniref:Uncharacterized protein n=1 Tax=Ditylenchus dipsaci TaxID=166011 RepID=A0A915DCR2_9BILA
MIRLLGAIVYFFAISAEISDNENAWLNTHSTHPNHRKNAQTPEDWTPKTKDTRRKDPAIVDSSLKNFALSLGMSEDNKMFHSYKHNGVPPDSFAASRNTGGNGRRSVQPNMAMSQPGQNEETFGKTRIKKSWLAKSKEYQIQHISALIFRRANDLEWSEPADRLFEVIGNGVVPGGYDMFLAPGQIQGKSTNVSVAIYIESMSSFRAQTMDFEVDMYLAMGWYDRRLSHNCTHPILIAHKFIADRLWRPDLYFLNSKFAYLQEVTTPNFMVIVYPDGLVFKAIRVDVTLSCMMNLELFPMDQQECPLVIQSYAYIENLVNLTWLVDPPNYPVARNPELKLNDMIITNMKFEKCSGPYAMFRGTGNWSCIRALIVMKRLVLFHLIQTYIPSGMLVSISWMTFWLDPRASPARISLTITSLLTLTTMSNGARQDLPQVSYIKAMDIWQTFSQALIFLVLLEYSFVSFYFTRRKFDCEHRKGTGKLRKKSRNKSELDRTLNLQDLVDDRKLPTSGPIRDFILRGSAFKHSISQRESSRIHNGTWAMSPSQPASFRKSIQAPLATWLNRQLKLRQEENEEESKYVDGCCCISNADAAKLELRHRNGSSQDTLDQEYTDTKCFGFCTTPAGNKVQPAVTLSPPKKCCLKEQEKSAETAESGAAEPNGQPRNNYSSQQQQHKRRRSMQKSLEIDRMLMDELWERKPCPHCQWNDEQKGRKIDEFSRIVFPSIFTIFSVSYWLYYSWYTQVNES